uniref:Uncharacterized protein n=1 Tax=Octopus bimaculoides TaxID=37653 RepID=A0A0L8I4X6_OCTBM
MSNWLKPSDLQSSDCARARLCPSISRSEERESIHLASITLYCTGPNPTHYPFLVQITCVLPVKWFLLLVGLQKNSNLK